MTSECFTFTTVSLYLIFIAVQNVLCFESSLLFCSCLSFIPSKEIFLLVNLLDSIFCSLNLFLLLVLCVRSSLSPSVEFSNYVLTLHISGKTDLKTSFSFAARRLKIQTNIFLTVLSQFRFSDVWIQFVHPALESCLKRRCDFLLSM